MLASPVITSVATVTPTTVSGTFTSPTSTAPQTTSVTVVFPTPMVVAANAVAGLHMEFDIPRSLVVAAGEVTGAITPVIYAEAVQASDSAGQITEFTGTIAAVSTASSSFTMQGPIGSQIKVGVDSSTTFNQGFTLSTLPATGAFAAIQGTVGKDGSILASDVELITTDSAFIAGRVLAFTPTTGAATSITLFVDETGGGTSALLDTVQTINIASVTVYNVCPFNNAWFTTTGLFSNLSLLVGQRILVGGTYASPTFAPDLISLRRQGVYGTIVPASVTVANAATGAGTFQISQTSLLGYTLAAPLKVNTGAGTQFSQGNSSALTLTNLGTASATASIGVVSRGLVLKDAISGDAVLWAHRVREVQAVTVAP